MKKARILPQIILKSVLAIVIFAVTASCNREEEPVLLVFSGDVEIFSENGAVFTARVSTNMDEPISNCGFTWQAIGLSDAVYEIELGPLDSEQFSYHVVSGMRHETAYEMQAWVVIGDKKALGHKVKFTSLGSQDPVITGLHPQTAHWGDTIEVTGRNFPLTDNLQTRFGSHPTSITSYSDTLIRILVPDALRDSVTKIAFRHIDDWIMSTQSFLIKMPEINSIHPQEATLGTDIMITGRGFIPELSMPFIGDIPIEVKKTSRDTLWGVLPVVCNAGNYKLNVLTYDSRVFSESTLHYQLYELHNIYPTEITWLDTVVLHGSGFDFDVLNRSILYGDYNASFLNWTDDSIRFIIPDGIYNQSQNPVILKLDSNFCNTGLNVNLKRPTIDSIVPNTIPLLGTVRVYGRNFHPVRSKNYFYMGGALADIFNFSDKSFSANVPFQQNHHHIETKLASNGLESNGSFINITPHEIHTLSTDRMFWNDDFFIYGENFHPTPEGNKVEFTSTSSFRSYELDLGINSNSQKLDVVYLDKIVPHGEYSVSVTMLNRKVESTDKVFVISPYERLNSPPFGSKVRPVYFTLNGKHYLGGGQQDSNNEFNDFYLYSPETDSWIGKKNLPEVGANHFSFATDDYGYAYIGYKFFRYDPYTDQWSYVGQFPDGFYHGIHFQIDNDHYVAGQSVIVNGQITGRKILKFIEHEMQWIRVADLPETNTQWGLGFGIGGKGYIGFGKNNNKIWEYDPISDSWSLKMTLGSEFLVNNAINGGSVVVVDDIAYIMGGWLNFPNPTPYSRHLYAFDPANNEFKQLVEMPYPWFYHGFIFKHNDLIYYGGGLQNFDVFVNTMFRINPSVLTEYYFNP